MDSNRRGTVEQAIDITRATALKGRGFESIEAQNDLMANWEKNWAGTRQRNTVNLFGKLRSTAIVSRSLSPPPSLSKPHPEFSHEQNRNRTCAVRTASFCCRRKRPKRSWQRFLSSAYRFVGNVDAEHVACNIYVNISTILLQILNCQLCEEVMPKRSPLHSGSPVLVAVGAAIRRERARVGLSQEALAVEAEIDRSYMGGVERGEQNLTLMSLKRIADVLGVKLAVLFSDDQS